MYCRTQTGEEPSVATAAAVFQELCYNHREQLTAGIIVAGYDKVKGGQVSYLLCIPYTTIEVLDCSNSIGGPNLINKLQMKFWYGSVSENRHMHCPYLKKTH